MALGIALILIFVLYLIDKHNQWRPAVKLTLALTALAILGLAGLFGWQEYGTWQTARQKALREAKETEQGARRQAELTNICKDWEDKHPAGSSLDKTKDVVLDDGRKVPEITWDPPRGCSGPLEASYAKAEAAEQRRNVAARRPAKVASQNEAHGPSENYTPQPPESPLPPPDGETFNSVYVTYYPDDWETARFTCSLHINTTERNLGMSCLPNHGLPASPKFSYFTTNVVLDEDTTLQKADCLAFHSEMDLRLACASKREANGDLKCTTPSLRKRN